MFIAGISTIGASVAGRRQRQAGSVTALEVIRGLALALVSKHACGLKVFARFRNKFVAVIARAFHATRRKSDFRRYGVTYLEMLNMNKCKKVSAT